VVHHRRWGRQSKRGGLHHEIDALALDGGAEGEVLVLELGEELAEGHGVHDGAGKAVLAELFRFLQHSDLDRAEGGIAFDQPRELDGAGEPGGTAAHEQHIHGNGFLARLRPGEKLVRGERELVVGGDEGRWHQANFSGSHSRPSSFGAAM
jgi:hypothetical protein